MSRAVGCLGLGPLGRAGSRVSTRLPRHSGPGAERDEEQRLDADRLRGRRGPVAGPPRVGVVVERAGPARPRRPAGSSQRLRAQRSAISTMLGAQLRRWRRRRSRSRPWPRRRGRRSASTCRRRGSPRAARPAVGDDPVEAQLGGRLAHDPAGGLGHPHLLGQRLALEGHDHGAAGLLGVRVEDRALRLARPAAVDGQVHGEGAAQRARRRRRAARSAGPAGARRRASSIGSMSGTQPQSSPASGSRRSCGTKRSRPQSSAFASSSSEPVDRRAGALELVAGRVAAGDGHRLERAVGPRRR